ncbi:hypothetical protein C4K00_2120 [Pseudomonas synxantha]|nr:hypothetical protein C4K00_2120 [Pseudomonas synxantha]AZE78016.1 hypothetical protein C4J99_2231 [Pseudomonas synxantha]
MLVFLLFLHTHQVRFTRAGQFLLNVLLIGQQPRALYREHMNLAANNCLAALYLEQLSPVQPFRARIMRS